MPRKTTETLAVTFENPEHQAYCHLLLEYGFDMTVGADLRVGLTFRHPTKQHIVRLDKDDDTARYDPHFFIYVRTKSITLTRQPQMDNYDTPMYPDHYSEIEWKWLSGDNPSTFEFLQRELHIWFKVRPMSMNTIPQIA